MHILDDCYCFYYIFECHLSDTKEITFIAGKTTFFSKRMYFITRNMMALQAHRVARWLKQTLLLQ